MATTSGTHGPDQQLRQVAAEIPVEAVDAAARQRGQLPGGREPGVARPQPQHMVDQAARSAATTDAAARWAATSPPQPSAALPRTTTARASSAGSAPQPGAAEERVGDRPREQPGLGDHQQRRAGGQCGGEGDRAPRRGGTRRSSQPGRPAHLDRGQEATGGRSGAAGAA